MRIKRTLKAASMWQDDQGEDMHYSNEFIDGLESGVSLDKDMYANIQAHNIAKMLAAKKSYRNLMKSCWPCFGIV